MKRISVVTRLALLAAVLVAIATIAPPKVSTADPGTYVGGRWLYDWDWRGYYHLYRTSLVRGARYAVQVVPETAVDDPDLFVGTSSPRGTNDPRCSPRNYLWKSTRAPGITDKIIFTAGYTGTHYFCVYAYSPRWVGWYVRVKRVW
jgi:hypothetical protein